MPNELQLIPLKLKQKLEYMSYYMYDIVQRDHIIGALTWLKNHNQFYNQIPINCNWCSAVPNSEIPNLLISGGTDDLLEESSTSSKHLKENTLCRKNVICDICEDDSVKIVQENVTLHQNDTNLTDNCNVRMDDSELLEDQIALEQKENLTGHLLPSMLQFENIENAIFQCAPGQNNIPRYILLYEEFELLAFPDLFPLRCFSYYSEQISVKLLLQKYFQQRLLNVDGQFAKNIEYIFCAQHMIDLQHIQSVINLAIRLSRGRTLNGIHIIASTLHNPQAIHQMVQNQVAYKFL